MRGSTGVRGISCADRNCYAARIEGQHPARKAVGCDILGGAAACGIETCMGYDARKAQAGEDSMSDLRITTAEQVLSGVLKLIWNDGYEGIVDLRSIIA